jgi:plasmid maintenance system antidote protein VapI
LYENLKIEMLKAGITIEKIAEEMGVHRNTIGNKINGDTPLNVDEALFIRNRWFPCLDFFYLFKKSRRVKQFEQTS